MQQAIVVQRPLDDIQQHLDAKSQFGAKPDSPFQAHGYALPRQIACPSTVVTMDALRWRLTPGASSLLCCTDCLHVMVLGVLSMEVTRTDGKTVRQGAMFMRLSIAAVLVPLHQQCGRTKDPGRS